MKIRPIYPGSLCQILRQSNRSHVSVSNGSLTGIRIWKGETFLVLSMMEIDEYGDGDIYVNMKLLHRGRIVGRYLLRHNMHEWFEAI